jgi:EpsI family protein
MLSVAYGGDQSDGTSAHRPEVCYPAQGFAISSNRIASLTLGGREIRVRQLMAHLGARHEPIMYWIVVGGEVVTSGIGQKLAQMRYGLRGIVADGMLVRVSSIGVNEGQQQQLHSRFVGDLHSVLEAGHRVRVFGGDFG